MRILKNLWGKNMSLLYRGIKKAMKNFKRSNSYLWVNSLCYLSIISIVPLFALAISFGRWLGIDEFLQRIIYENSPFDQKNIEDLIEISQNLLNSVRGGIFTGAGALFLGWSLISMFSCIEKAFNSIWNVKKIRSLTRRITDYTTIFIFLIFIILAARGTLTLFYGYFDSTVLYVIIFRETLGYMFLTLGFTALFYLIPNTKVKFIAAFISGIFTAFLFGQMQLIMVWLQEIILKYNRIYGSFAIVLIFLTWMQFFWIFILLGAHLSCLLQNRSEIYSIVDKEKINFVSKLRIALDLLIYLAENYVNDEESLTISELSQRTQIPWAIVEDILLILKNEKIVAEVVLDRDRTGYKLVKNIESLTFDDIWNAIAFYGETYEFYSIETQQRLDHWLKYTKGNTLLKQILEKKEEV
jgi:membrane protein